MGIGEDDGSVLNESNPIAQIVLGTECPKHSSSASIDGNHPRGSVHLSVDPIQERYQDNAFTCQNGMCSPLARSQPVVRTPSMSTGLPGREMPRLLSYP